MGGGDHMEQVLSNEYVRWIITGIVAGLFGIVTTLLKRQQAAQEKRIEKVEAENARDQERLNDVIAQMPIQYTLRDEFLRVTTDQNRKLDKISDSMNDLSRGVAAIKAALTGGMRNDGNQ